MTISAAFTIDGNANPARHTTTYGATVPLALVSNAGIDSVQFTIVSSSKSGTTIPTLTEGGSPPGATASFAMPADPGDGLGRSFRIRCVVRSQYETDTTYGIVGVPNIDGRLPICFDEEKDRSTTGYTDELNEALAASTSTAASFNILSYGASPSASAATNTTAIQDAIDAAEAENGTVFVPPGTFTLNAGLTSTAPLFIRGSGAGVSILKFNCAASFAGITFGASASYGKLSGVSNLSIVNAGVDGTYAIKTPAQADQYDTYDQKFLFENLEIRGDTFTGGAAYYPATDQTFTSGHIFIGDCKSAKVNNVKINGAFDVNADPSGQVTDKGLVIAPTTAALTVRVENLELAALHTAVSATGSAFYSLSDFDFIGVYRGVDHVGGAEAKIHTGIINAQHYGIYMQDSFSRSIHDVDVQRLAGAWTGATNDWYGVWFNNVSSPSVSGSKFQHGASAYGGGFTSYGIYADGGTAGIKISDNAFSVGTDVGVYLDNVAGFSVTDSVLSNSDAMTYVYLATNSRYGSILGVTQSTIAVTHTMIDDDGSVSETSYQRLTENVTGFHRRTYGGVLTISSGSITPTKSFHLVDTEASAASDDLDTIVAPTKFPYWIDLELRGASSSRDVTLKHNTGNLRLAGDFTLLDANYWIKLAYDGSVWKEVSRSANSNVNDVGDRVNGTDLTNGAETLQVGDGGIRTLRDGTLSGATTRAKTLGTTGATAGRIITLNLLDDNAAETVTVVNGGSGGGTLVTHTAIKARYEFRFDGTDWVLSGWDVVA